MHIVSYHAGGQVDVVRPDKLPIPTGNLYCSIFTTQQKVKKKSSGTAVTKNISLPMKTLIFMNTCLPKLYL